jgi:YihY family inner membrane protein
MDVRALLSRLDQAQRGQLWLAFPLAVAKKFGEDRAGSHAALIAYYGFFSIFPLLLALTTVLGFLLANDPGLRERIVDSALSSFPVIGTQIRENVNEIEGSGVTLFVAMVFAVWTGLGVVRTAQVAMDDVWDVPKGERPGFLPATARALALLLVFGAALAVSAVLAGLSSSEGRFGFVTQVLSFVATVLLNAFLFTTAFRVLTTAKIRWRDVLPGGIVAAAGWAVLQFLGTWLVQRQLAEATEIYGFFAAVIGLLSWIFIAAQLTLVAAEINVVRSRHLWPRSLVAAPPTGPEVDAITRAAEEEERRGQEVDVRFTEPRA